MYSDMYRKHFTKQNNQPLQGLSWFNRSAPMQKVWCSNPGGDKPKLIKLKMTTLGNGCKYHWSSVMT